MDDRSDDARDTDDRDDAREADDRSALGREKTPAEVALLVVAALLAAGLAGAGVFAHFTRMHPPFGPRAAPLLAAGVVGLAGVASWAEASRRAARPPAWVVALTLLGCAVAVPLALISALGSTGAPGRIATLAAGVLLLGVLPIVTGLAAHRDRPVSLPLLPAAAVAGGAALGVALAVTVAVLEAPAFPEHAMAPSAAATWEAFTSAGTVEFQSLRRSPGDSGDTGGTERVSVRGRVDMAAARARYTVHAGAGERASEEVSWDAAAPWTAAGPVERLWRSLTGVGAWEEVAGGRQGVIDPRRVTAARIATMDGLRDRVGARWHMGEATDGSVTTVLVQTDADGFPTRLVTRERAAGAATETLTTTTFRR